MTAATTANSTQQQQDALLQDTTLGCQFAALAILDDDTERLSNEKSFGFWHRHAVEMVTQTFDDPSEWQRGLTHVLNKSFGLAVDKIVNLHELTPNRRVIDVQGYIAHNDEQVVISYQGTASLRDNWINADFLTSEWEVEQDTAQRYAGNFSVLEGRQLLQRNAGARNLDDDAKFRVHTGFYNNFLAIVPFLQQYVLPLIAKDQPPRKIRVCGHSLGGAIATLTGVYLWQNYDWNRIPQQLCVVSAGAPRPLQTDMAQALDQQLKQECSTSDNVAFVRVRRNQDAIPTLPLRKMGFGHFPMAATFLTANHDIVLLQQDDKDSHKMANRNHAAGSKDANESPRCFVTRIRGRRGRVAAAKDIQSLAINDAEADYWQRTQGFPGPVRDHFPTLYLLPFRNECPNLFRTATTPSSKIQ